MINISEVQLDIVQCMMLGYTNGYPPHCIRSAGFCRLQNPGLAVNLIQDVPKCCQGLQNQLELLVQLDQSTLVNETKTDTAVIYRQEYSEVLQ